MEVERHSNYDFCSSAKTKAIKGKDGKARIYSLNQGDNSIMML
jgi:hypothetical protein